MRISSFGFPKIIHRDKSISEACYMKQTKTTIQVSSQYANWVYKVNKKSHCMIKKNLYFYIMILYKNKSI